MKLTKTKTLKLGTGFKPFLNYEPGVVKIDPDTLAKNFDRAKSAKL